MKEAYAELGIQVVDMRILRKHRITSRLKEEADNLWGLEDLNLENNFPLKLFS